MAAEPPQRSHADGISRVYLGAVAAMLLSIVGWVVCIALTASGVVDSWVPATRWIWLAGGAVGAAAGLSTTWRGAKNDPARTGSSGISLRRRIPMVLVLFPWKGSPMALVGLGCAYLAVRYPDPSLSPVLFVLGISSVGLAFAGLLLTVPVGSAESRRRT